MSLHMYPTVACTTGSELAAPQAFAYADLDAPYTQLNLTEFQATALYRVYKYDSVLQEYTRLIEGTDFSVDLVENRVDLVQALIATDTALCLPNTRLELLFGGETGESKTVEVPLWLKREGAFLYHDILIASQDMVDPWDTPVIAADLVFTDGVANAAGNIGDMTGRIVSRIGASNKNEFVGEVFSSTYSNEPSVAQIVDITCTADENLNGRTLDGTYFLIDSPNDSFYVWISVDTPGTDPALAGKIGIPVTVAAGASNTAVAAAVGSAIDGRAEFSTSVSGDTVTVTTAFGGASAAPMAGNGTGFELVITTQGVDAITGVQEETEITCTVATTLNNTYFLLDAIEGGFYVWIDVDSNGVDPAVGGRVGVPVAVLGGDSAAIVANKVAAEIEALAEFTASAATGTVTIVADTPGVVADTVDGATPTGFGFTTTVQGVTAAGAIAEATQFKCAADMSSSLNNAYILLDSTSTLYYIWFNVGAAGTDPALSNRTGIEVAIAVDATETDVAVAMQAAVDVLGAFSASIANEYVTVTNAVAGAVKDVLDFKDPNIQVNVTTPGEDALDVTIVTLTDNTVNKTAADTTFMEKGRFVFCKADGSGDPDGSYYHGLNLADVLDDSSVKVFIKDTWVIPSDAVNYPNQAIRISCTEYLE